MTTLTVPQLSISMEDAKVARWLVADGDAVEEGDPIVEVETDKATMDVVAPCAGVVRIVAPEGAVVPVDGVLADIGEASPIPFAGAATRTAAGAAAPESSGRAAVAAAAPPSRRDGPIASPAARRLAREQGLDVGGLIGTGPGGRIVARDVSAAVATTPAVAPDARDGLGGIREAVVRSITASWQQVPHVHIGGELAAAGLVEARAALRASGGGAITVTDLLVVALARALVDVPELNAIRRPDGSVERSRAVHLSLAVATAAGVVAPVLRDAGLRAPAEVAAERSRLVESARSGRIDGRDLAGGTCTLSNLGALPVDFFAPVISSPQVAMVATGRVAERVVAEQGLIGVRPRMWVNVAIDHRAADGEAGGRLLVALERQIALLPGGLR